jgi:hypothetical protein
MQSDAEGDAVEVQATRLLRSGVDPAEAARKRWERESGVTSETLDPASILRELLARQVKIARGTAKGTTPAQETAAAREVRELLAAIAGLGVEDESEVAWDNLDATKRDACRRVIASDVSFAAHVLTIEAPEGSEAEAESGERGPRVDAWRAGGQLPTSSLNSRRSNHR